MLSRRALSIHQYASSLRNSNQICNQIGDYKNCRFFISIPHLSNWTLLSKDRSTSLSSYSSNFVTSNSTNINKFKSSPYFTQWNTVRFYSYKRKKNKHTNQKQSPSQKNKPKIEITKTSAAQAPVEIQKPEDQIKEEKIRDLQAEIAFHHRHAQYSEALIVSEQLLEHSIDHFTKKHPVTASAYNNVGLMHKYLGNFDQAKEMYYEGLRIYADTVGKDHANYAATLNNLGNLLRAQCMAQDDDDDDDNNGYPPLTALQRLQYNELAVEFFEEALQIRQEELGKDHPHTITSHSNLGAAMASMLLQEQLNRNKNETNDENDFNTKTTKFTKTRWEAAEHHLRTALNTAVQNPRGKTISSTEQTDSSSGFPKVITLSAAGAAQNLAVFLKSKADSLLQTSKSNNSNHNNDTNDMYAEALNLYQSALHVRLELLSDSHPDTIATKFSLAELLVAAYDDEESANQLRQEILDAYSVEERDMK